MSYSSNTLLIGHGSIDLGSINSKGYKQIISWKEYIWMEDGRNEIVEMYLFKTKRSFYLRFATSIVTGSPIVITKQLGLDLGLYRQFDYESAEDVGTFVGFGIGYETVDLNECVENKHITKGSNKWRGLPSVFSTTQTWRGHSHKLGACDFKAISFNLEKEYLSK